MRKKKFTLVSVVVLSILLALVGAVGNALLPRLDGTRAAESKPEVTTVLEVNNDDPVRLTLKNPPVTITSPVEYKVGDRVVVYQIDQKNFLGGSNTRAYEGKVYSLDLLEAPLKKWAVALSAGLILLLSLSLGMLVALLPTTRNFIKTSRLEPVKPESYREIFFGMALVTVIPFASLMAYAGDLNYGLSQSLVLALALVLGLRKAAKLVARTAVRLTADKTQSSKDVEANATETGASSD